MTTEDKEKDSYIRIRIDSQTKEMFAQICKAKCINSSELIRQLISTWIKEQQTAAHRRQTDIKNAG